jgi:hypothetical protein
MKRACLAVVLLACLSWATAATAVGQQDKADAGTPSHWYLT